MRLTRDAVELAYTWTLLTKVFFIHKEKIDACIHKRAVRPITANSYTENTTEQVWLNTADIGNGQLQSGTVPADLENPKPDMKHNTMQEVLGYTYMYILWTT